MPNKLDNNKPQNMANPNGHIGGNNYLNQRAMQGGSSMPGLSNRSANGLPNRATSGLGRKNSDLSKNDDSLNSLENESSKSDSEKSDSISDDVGGSSSAKNTDKGAKVDFKVPLKVKIVVIISIIKTVAIIAVITLIVIFVGAIASAALFSVGDAFSKFVEGEEIYYNGDQESLERQYYDELIRIQKKRFKDEKVCVDTNLISAALIVESTFQPNDDGYVDVVFDPDSDEANTPNDDKARALDYKRMKKQIELLSNMQIKHIRRGWDTDMPVHGMGTGYCRHHDDEAGTTEELVDEENWTRFDFDGWFLDDTKKTFLKQHMNSTSPEEVAKNDMNSFFAFFVKKADEEKNYEYRLFQPLASYKCLPEGNPNCTYREVCDAEMEEEEAEISIGDEADYMNTMKDGVFYWNLYNSFIPEYYSDYLPDENDEEKAAERDQLIHEMADSVYLLYKTMGPSHDCSKYVNPDEDEDGENGRKKGWTDSALCPDGIMVKEKDGTVNTHYLEEYVAGVVAAENGWHVPEDNIESMKAQAIAARSFALSRTSGCSTIINNSQGDQAYVTTDDPYAIRAAQETAGVVLRNADGSIYHAQYDAFCVSSYSPVNDSYTIRQKSQVIPKSFVDVHGTFCKGTSEPAKCGCNGHGAGMSQIGARYLQSTGSDHKQILAFYYTNAVLDESNKGSGVGGADAGPWSNWKQTQEPWGSLDMPKPNKKCSTISNCGCAITSLAILIARSGVPTSLDPDFNPGTFYQAIKPHMNGNGVTWNEPSIVTPYIKLHTVVYPSQSSLEKLREFLRQGYYVIVGVKGNGHWVVVLGENGNTFDIVDPGWDKTSLSQWDNSIGSIIVYKVIN